MNIRNLLSRRYLDLKTMLLVISFVFLGFSVYKLYQDSKQFEYLEIVLSQNEQQTRILRDENYQLTHPTPTPDPGLTYSEDRKLNIPAKYNFILLCPDRIQCSFNDSQGYRVISIGNSANLTFHTVDLKTLNNPNYVSVIKWYDGLLHKDPKAAGENLDPFYGVIPVEGTDALIYPFYRSYDLDSITAYIFGNDPGLVVKSQETYTTDFLIPHGNYVYRFVLGNTEENNIGLVKQTLSTIQFVK